MNDDRDGELARWFATRKSAPDPQLFMARVTHALESERRGPRLPAISSLVVMICAAIVAAPYVADTLLALADSGLLAAADTLLRIPRG
jgi:hypothetical protein